MSGFCFGLPDNKGEISNYQKNQLTQVLKDLRLRYIKSNGEDKFLKLSDCIYDPDEQDWREDNKLYFSDMVCCIGQASCEREVRNFWVKFQEDWNNTRSPKCPMNYFDGKKNYLSICDAIDAAFAEGRSSGIESEYFKITCYKKQTIHLTFRSDDILRRFNIAACKGKRWLPPDYGTKNYKDMSSEEKGVIRSFENVGEYIKGMGQVGFAKAESKMFQIGMSDG
jgi:hypothetical protein